jgi:hypothetical protein
MKVLLHYEDNDNTDLHKSFKITLPKSWKTGHVNVLLGQFVETYNSNEVFASSNRLDQNKLHLALRHLDGEKSKLVALASDAVVLDVIPDRADLYVMHGPSQTVEEMKTDEEREMEHKKAEKLNTVACTHFGCKNRFPPGGPYPECHYHTAPPVFHETAKFWSCCPNKKAYDWDDFQNIPGCQTGICSEVKENDGQKQFLGGTDLREQAGETVKLKSIDDFNKAQAAGGSDAAPVLERLRGVLADLGVENELFDQVVDGMTKELGSQMTDEVDSLGMVAKLLGDKLKAFMKTIAVEQLRIK